MEVAKESTSVLWKSDDFGSLLVTSVKLCVCVPVLQATDFINEG